MPFFRKDGDFYGTFKRIISEQRCSQGQYSGQCLPIFYGQQQLRQTGKRTLCHADDSGVFAIFS